MPLADDYAIAMPPALLLSRCHYFSLIALFSLMLFDISILIIASADITPLRCPLLFSLREALRVMAAGRGACCAARSGEARGAMVFADFTACCLRHAAIIATFIFLDAAIAAFAAAIFCFADAAIDAADYYCFSPLSPAQACAQRAPRERIALLTPRLYSPLFSPRLPAIIIFAYAAYATLMIFSIIFLHFHVLRASGARSMRAASAIICRRRYSICHAAMPLPRCFQWRPYFLRDARRARRTRFLPAVPFAVHDAALMFARGAADVYAAAEKDVFCLCAPVHCGVAHFRQRPPPAQNAFPSHVRTTTACPRCISPR